MNSKTAADPAAILREDHQRILDLLERCNSTNEEDRITAIRKVIAEISKHLSVVEECLLHFVKDRFSDVMHDDAIKEHLDIKRLVADLEVIDPLEPRVPGIVESLTEAFKSYVQNEEERSISKLKECDAASAASLLDSLTKERMIAPVRVPINLHHHLLPTA
eukprot:GILK01019744.1.p1 GENE.GILK01019744.1~~GILK01019744.1.p1  ORF type:complete len:162 (+),score=31.77 GILK01019744.1:53-538(+)